MRALFSRRRRRKEFACFGCCVPWCVKREGTTQNGTLEEKNIRKKKGTTTTTTFLIHTVRAAYLRGPCLRLCAVHGKRRGYIIL
jgi:hypothetical protein